MNASKPKAIQLVVAAADLPVGVTLSQKDVALLDWYSDVLPSGVFTKTDAVVGHPLLYPMSAKEPILQRDLGVEGAVRLHLFPLLYVEFAQKGVYARYPGIDIRNGEANQSLWAHVSALSLGTSLQLKH